MLGLEHRTIDLVYGEPNHSANQVAQRRQWSLTKKMYEEYIASLEQRTLAGKFF